MKFRKTGIYGFRLDDGKTVEERLEEVLREFQNGTEGKNCLSGAQAPVPEAGKIFRGDRGKPYLFGCPGLGLSITHSGPFWFCGLAEGDLGIDLQEHTVRDGESREQAEVRYRKMAVRFFQEREAAYVLEGDSFRRFFRIWAAKEAYVKYTGQGIDDDFGNFSVVPENPDREWQVEGEPEEDGGLGVLSDETSLTFRRWMAGGVWFAEVPVRAEGEYTLCMCSAAPACPELKWMSGPAGSGAKKEGGWL